MTANEALDYIFENTGIELYSSEYDELEKALEVIIEKTKNDAIKLLDS